MPISLSSLLTSWDVFQWKTSRKNTQSRFPIIGGITETKIKNSDDSNFCPNIVGYVFEYVASGFAGPSVFVDRLKDYSCFSREDLK